MTYDELFDHVLELLQREERLSYRVLKRQLELDDDDIEDLKEDLIYAKKLARDEDGRVLVWGGEGALGDAPQTPLSYTPSHLTHKILASRGDLAGERKQITVCFADIKSSTALIEGLDPEDAGGLIDPVLHLMMEAVHRYEGTVSLILGDGLMALFGAPLAHEDHASRACYAALAMQAAMQDYAETLRQSRGLDMKIRVGLHSGEVVVRTISNDLRMEYSAIGGTTHLAARMEQLATPGSIRLTAATMRLVEGLVRVNTLGPMSVKGLTESVEVFELIGASTTRRRLQAAALRGLTRFIGREAELAAIDQARQLVEAGRGQIVAAVGEPGVGKSRLIYEYMQVVGTQGWRVMESASVSYGKATAYFPVIDCLNRYMGLDIDDTPETIQDKVTRHILTLDDNLESVIPPLLLLLDAIPEDHEFWRLSPSRRRQHTLDALKQVILRESEVQPVYLVFEDLQWIDSETQALLDDLVESLSTTRILLLVNYRPEYQHQWGDQRFYTQLELRPLLPANASALLQILLGNDSTLDVLKDTLITRTAGNPFFIEESVRTLAESEALVGEPGNYCVAEPLTTVKVPATVQVVLAARMDRLKPAEKGLLQTAAVIGTEVPLSLLSAVAELSKDMLYLNLAHLQSAGFLYESSLFPEPIYTFRHALTHEVAYSSLLQEHRRVLHARIVDELERSYHKRLVDQAERLAYHALRGEIWDKALFYSRQAGQKLLERTVYSEAVDQLEQALTALRQLPESRDTWEQAVDLCFSLRGALLSLREFERMVAVLNEAERLSHALGDKTRLGHIASYMARYYFLMGEHEEAMAAGQRALALAEELSDFPLQIGGNMYLGQVYYAMGGYHAAIEVTRQNIESLDGGKRFERYRQVNLPSVTSRTYLALSLGELGLCADGMTYAVEGLQIAESVEHSNSISIASMGVGLVALIQGDLPSAIPALKRCLDLTQGGNIPVLFPVAVTALGYAYALARRPEEALDLVTQVEPEALLPTPLSSMVFVWLSETFHLTGRAAEADHFAAQAYDLSKERQEHGNHAWSLRLMGELTAQRSQSDMDRAEAYYQEGLQAAHKLDMQPLMAHCHLSLGRLYQQVDRPQASHMALSEAQQRYQAMHMPFWQQQAKALM